MFSNNKIFIQQDKNVFNKSKILSNKTKISNVTKVYIVRLSQQITEKKHLPMKAAKIICFQNKTAKS